jgi:hypothetical protein
MMPSYFANGVFEIQFEIDHPENRDVEQVARDLVRPFVNDDARKRQQADDKSGDQDHAGSSGGAVRPARGAYKLCGAANAPDVEVINPIRAMHVNFFIFERSLFLVVGRMLGSTRSRGATRAGSANCHRQRVIKLTGEGEIAPYERPKAGPPMKITNVRRFENREARAQSGLFASLSDPRQQQVRKSDVKLKVNIPSH